LAVIAPGQVSSYEGDSFPEDDGWQRAVYCTPVRSLDGGELVVDVELGCDGPPGGDRDTYTRSIGEFAGTGSFFFEWRVITNGDRSEIIGVAPCSFVTADLYGVSYHFTIARDQVRLIRDNFLPIIFVDLQWDVLHTYRLELRAGKEYRWFIDGEVVDVGTPEGAYPTETAVVQWRTKAWYLPNTTWWSYIRYGHLPADASGDFNSDLAVTLVDWYFVSDCLTKDGPGIFGGPIMDNAGPGAGPGCRFVDMEGNAGEPDGDVDLADFAAFQNLFTGYLP
jgi:hypothetical protein